MRNAGVPRGGPGRTAPYSVGARGAGSGSYGRGGAGAGGGGRW